jgi:hypothetical protein
MPKFKVDITRIGYGHATIEIEADDLFDAREKAHEAAGNYSYSEKSADYEVGTATEIKTVEPVPHKFFMLMHIEGDTGDIDVKELRVSTLDENEVYKTASALYEQTPNMVCIQVINYFSKVMFEQKVEHYVP